MCRLVVVAGHSAFVCVEKSVCIVVYIYQSLVVRICVVKDQSISLCICEGRWQFCSVV